MCGLVVFLDPWIFVNAAKSMEIALAAIGHRGLPGRSAWRKAGDVMLGHVRLPIQGLSTDYDQPFYTTDWAGVFVGEVLDCGEVNDADWALKALYRHGPEPLALSDGFWAMALHDKNELITTILTDHLSIKPLYWHKELGIVASELRAIEAVVPNLTINRHYLSDVLKWGYCPTEATPYEEVNRLKAGHCYTFVKKEIKSCRKYFRLEPLIGSLEYEIRKAVVNRLVSDVPVATLCSGGLDSTIVSLLAAKYSKQGMTVFHIEGNKDDTLYFDQIQWPGDVSVRKIRIEPLRLEDALTATEEPVDLGSVLPQYQLGKAVSDAEFNVVLTGDGADELFGGYKRASEYDSQWSDIFSELVHYHCPRLDKTMMASTVELRSPFLAPRVIECALNTPYGMRTHKQALAEAFRGIVPDQIIDRKKVPLRTLECEEGGIEYRQKVIDCFLNRRKL